MPTRRLPHEYPENQWLFITCHLHGSLPAGKYPPPPSGSAGEAFVWMDRYLDTTRTGPMYLKQPQIARIVIDSLYKGVELGHYELGPYVLMANHIHLLLLPKIDPSKLLKSFKGTTAGEANKILQRTDEPFWQAESYDHYVRDAKEWNRIARYIEENPVKAGLVPHAAAYAFSSASVDMSVDAAGMSACATRKEVVHAR
jgi:putative transposase